VERQTTLVSHCWWWKGIHPHVYTVEYGKRYISSSYCWWWQEMHPYVYTVDCGRGYNLMVTLLMVDCATKFPVQNLSAICLEV
jgi:hypothetical protein